MTPLGNGTRRRNFAITFDNINMVANFFLLISELVDEEVVPICVSCHRQRFSKKKRPIIPLQLASILGAWVIYLH